LLDLHAIGVEYPIEDGRVAAPRRLEHQRLVVADAGTPVPQAPELIAGE